ncbi:hypothetical protein [Sneathiella limimaris]|uniref:hypothetical protein n=1 Tax=Sneathiella limimaris TaxID=1964213 RepID=UPI00146E295A|nr:hypothetical protein [Sneathiella limimaris]
MKRKLKKRIIRNVAICGVLSMTLTGCVETIFAGLTIADLLTAGSITSSILTGKGLGEHALDAVTGQDCRILEAIFRKNRAVCEPRDSVATNDDFKGLVGLLDTPAGQDIQLADIPMGEDQYTAVNLKARAISPKLLKTLKINSGVTIGNQQLVADKREMQLLKATAKFTKPVTADISPVEAPELRRRLVSGGLF